MANALAIVSALQACITEFSIFRWLTRYNNDPRTYDARHNTMSAELFRNDIARAANQTR